MSSIRRLNVHTPLRGSVERVLNTVRTGSSTTETSRDHQLARRDDVAAGRLATTVNGTCSKSNSVAGRLGENTRSRSRCRRARPTRGGGRGDSEVAGLCRSAPARSRPARRPERVESAGSANARDRERHRRARTGGLWLVSAMSNVAGTPGGGRRWLRRRHRHVGGCDQSRSAAAPRRRSARGSRTHACRPCR